MGGFAADRERPTLADKDLSWLQIQAYRTDNK
jgi:hypothetical protein